MSQVKLTALVFAHVYTVEYLQIIKNVRVLPGIIAIRNCGRSICRSCLFN